MSGVDQLSENSINFHDLKLTTFLVLKPDIKIHWDSVLESISFPKCNAYYANVYLEGLNGI